MELLPQAHASPRSPPIPCTLVHVGDVDWMVLKCLLLVHICEGERDGSGKEAESPPCGIVHLQQ